MTTLTYRFAAYCPDPRGGDNNFTFDDYVDVPARLKPSLVQETIVSAFPDHVLRSTGVRVDPQYVVVQLLELVNQENHPK